MKHFNGILKPMFMRGFCNHKYRILSILSYTANHKEIIEQYEFVCTRCGKRHIVRMDQQYQGAETHFYS